MLRKTYVRYRRIYLDRMLSSSRKFILILLSIAAGLTAVAYIVSSSKQPQAPTALSPTPSLAVTLAAGFPGVPIYPGAILSTYSDEEMEGEIKHQYQATWETPDPIPTVMGWYENNRMPNWKTVTSSSDPRATGAQDAEFSLDNWKIYIVIQKRDQEPTYIFVKADPK